MEQSTTTQPQAGTRFDLPQIITDKFIANLKNNIVPWHLSMTTAGIPANLITKEQYRGINALLLLMAGCEQNLFLTFDQVHALGGKVKAGSKGYSVVRWDKPKDGAAQKEPAASGDAQKLFMKQYTVFNIEQCDIPEPAMQTLAKPQPLLNVDLVIKGMPKAPKIVYQNNVLHYDVVEDTVYAPKLKKKDKALHDIVLIHLLVHSTGHDSRLARNGVAEMGEQLENPVLYSKEELVAAIGTCFLCKQTGIVHDDPVNPAYAQGWMEVLQANKWLIFNAAREAQKAVDFILNVKGIKKELKPEEA